MPLVNEVVVPIGFKDYFNGSNPRGDAAFLPKVNDPELPHLISAVYGALFPEVPDTNGDKAGVQRSDLVQVFLTGLPGLNKPDDVRRSEMLRLNMDVAPCTMRLLDARCDRRRHRRVPERPSSERRHHRHRSARRDGGPDPRSRHGRRRSGRRRRTRTTSSFLSEFPYVAYPHSGSDADPHAAP